MACKRLKLDPKKCLPKISGMPTRYQQATVAVAKLFIITEAANEGKEFDWNDYNQLKYRAWFDMEVSKNNPSGFRFRGTLYSYSAAAAGSGSRLCFFTNADAEYHGKKFLALYRAIMVVPKKAKRAPANKK